MSQPIGPNFSIFGNTVGGLLGQQTTGGQWQQQVQSGSTVFPIQFGPMLQQQPFKKLLHTPKGADAFKSLTAYLRALMACEEHCECKWCAASELERKMAIVLFLKPEANEEE